MHCPGGDPAGAWHTAGIWNLSILPRRIHLVQTRACRAVNRGISRVPRILLEGDLAAFSDGSECGVGHPHAPPHFGECVGCEGAHLTRGTGREGTASSSSVGMTDDRPRQRYGSARRTRGSHDDPQNHLPRFRFGCPDPSVHPGRKPQAASIILWEGVAAFQHQNGLKTPKAAPPLGRRLRGTRPWPTRCRWTCRGCRGRRRSAHRRWERSSWRSLRRRRARCR